MAEKYRFDLAQKYRALLENHKSKLELSPSQITAEANRIALHKPQINGVTLFENEPTNLDQLPPLVILTIDNGNHCCEQKIDNGLSDHNRHTFKGEVKGKITLFDPSGLKSKDLSDNLQAILKKMMLRMGRLLQIN